MRAVATHCEQGQLALIQAHGALAVNQNKILLKRIMAATENEQVCAGVEPLVYVCTREL